MRPHPDFADVDLPRSVAVGRFRLAPLSMAEVDEDFEAVTASASVLKGVFGDWPEGLTREENLIDLAWHDREFTLRRSFSWIARDDLGHYLGCAYLFPDPGMRKQAEVATWIRDMPDRAAIHQDFVCALKAWFETVLPADIALRWKAPPAAG